MAAPSFSKLLRYSRFVELGDFKGRLLVGRIVHRVMDDIYVDFGCKFNAVCRRTDKKDAEKYVIGTDVVIRLHDTELSERFLGSKHDLTLLEADAFLIGLYHPKRQQQTNPTYPGGQRPTARQTVQMQSAQQEDLD